MTGVCFLRHSALVAALAILIAGCERTSPPTSTPSTFHLLPELTHTETTRNALGESFSAKFDFVVVSNPPAERKALLALIDKYNAMSLSQDELAKHHFYIRRFFKESAKTPRSYRESHKGYFDIDRWEDHSEDLLLVVKWRDFGKTRNYEFPQSE